LMEKFYLQTIRVPVRQCRGRSQRTADAVAAKWALACHLMSFGISFVVFDVEHDNILR